MLYINCYLQDTKPLMLTDRSDGIAAWESQLIPAPSNLLIRDMDFKSVDFGSSISVSFFFFFVMKRRTRAITQGVY
jgi:hypothetical protein